MLLLQPTDRLGISDAAPWLGRLAYDDYDMTAIPEGQAVLAYGGQAVAIDFEHDRSTTRLLDKVRRS